MGELEWNRQQSVNLLTMALTSGADAHACIRATGHFNNNNHHHHHRDGN